MSDRSRPLTAQAKAKIASCYRQGEPIFKIAARYGISSAYVQVIRRRHKVPKRYPNKVKDKLSDQQRLRLSRNYASGMSMTDVAKRYRVSNATVYRVLAMHDVDRRPRHQRIKRRYALNEMAFASVNERSAYWAGFLLADGHVCSKWRRSTVITLDLGKKDGSHLHKFKKFLGAAHPVRRGHRGSSVVFSVSSERLGADLEKLGIVEKKTCRFQSKTLSNDRHFWRGVMDGDGTVCVSYLSGNPRPTVSLVGSRDVVSTFVKFIRNAVIMTSALAHKRHGKRCLFGVSVSGSAACEIIALLYRGCHVALDRKQIIAEMILRKFGGQYSGR